MQTPLPKTLHYKRSNFATQLPVDFLYSPSHAWLARQPDGRWRAGLTKFATRMLGEMVDHSFETQPGAAVQLGQIIGWVEGFKAISDIYCAMAGQFRGSNPLLKEQIILISNDPFGDGWLYEVEGTPDPKCMEVHAYRDLLDETIERLLGQQKAEEPQ
jgi:glycine cleavage system H protein